MERDMLRRVKVDEYRLEMWATARRRDWRGQTRIGYRFTDGQGVVVFEGEDFAGSPMHADDSDKTLRSLLTFLTLRPGDTDREYFEGYTPEQMAFARGDAERLSLYAIDPAELGEEWAFVDVDENGLAIGPDDEA